MAFCGDSQMPFKEAVQEWDVVSEVPGGAAATDTTPNDNPIQIDMTGTDPTAANAVGTDTRPTDTTATSTIRTANAAPNATRPDKTPSDTISDTTATSTIQIDLPETDTTPSDTTATTTIQIDLPDTFTTAPTATPSGTTGYIRKIVSQALSCLLRRIFGHKDNERKWWSRVFGRFRSLLIRS